MHNYGRKKLFKMNSLKNQGQWQKEGKRSSIINNIKSEICAQNPQLKLLHRGPAKKGFKLLEKQPQNHSPLSKVINIDQTINFLL